MIPTTNNEEITKVITTIKKLVALTKGDRTNREGEVEAAMGKIQLLLSKHNLSMMDVTLDTEDDTSKIIKKVDEMRFVDRHYQRTLARAVATLCGCDFVMNMTYHNTTRRCYKKRQLMYIGYISDVHISFALYNELIKTVDKMGSDYLKEMKESDDEMYYNYSNNDWNVLRLSYNLGVCERLDSRACEAKREQEGLNEQEKIQITALVRVKDLNISKWENENMNLTNNKSRFSRSDNMARMHGYRDGANVNLTGRKSIK